VNKAPPPQLKPSSVVDPQVQINTTSNLGKSWKILNKILTFFVLNPQEMKDSLSVIYGMEKHLQGLTQASRLRQGITDSLQQELDAMHFHQDGLEHKAI